MFGDVLASLTHNGPGIGTTCMTDFVENKTISELSKFGAECASPEDLDYQKGFSQEYSDDVAGKMMFNCECSIANDYNKYLIWSCQPRNQEEIEVPGRNLMQTQDILFNLTNLEDRGRTNTSTNNDWILGTYDLDQRCRGLRGPNINF